MTTKMTFEQMVTKACETVGNKFMSRSAIKGFLKENFGYSDSAMAKNALKKALAKFEKKGDSFRVSKAQKSSGVDAAKKAAAKAKLAEKKRIAAEKAKAKKLAAQVKKAAAKEKLAAKKAAKKAALQAKKEKAAAKKAAAKAKKASKPKKVVKKAVKKTTKKKTVSKKK